MGNVGNGKYTLSFVNLPKGYIQDKKKKIYMFKWIISIWFRMAKSCDNGFSTVYSEKKKTHTHTHTDRCLLEICFFSLYID